MLELEDIWMTKHPRDRETLPFSWTDIKHNSRTDTSWISKSLTIKKSARKAEIQPKTFADHNPKDVVLQWNKHQEEVGN